MSRYDLEFDEFLCDGMRDANFFPWRGAAANFVDQDERILRSNPWHNFGIKMMLVS